MKSLLRGCLTVLLAIVVLVMLAAWYGGLMMLALYHIVPTKYSVYWTNYVDNLWYFLWSNYHTNKR